MQKNCSHHGVRNLIVSQKVLSHQVTNYLYLFGTSRFTCKRWYTDRQRDPQRARRSPADSLTAHYVDITSPYSTLDVEFTRQIADGDDWTHKIVNVSLIQRHLVRNYKLDKKAAIANYRHLLWSICYRVIDSI